MKRRKLLYAGLAVFIIYSFILFNVAQAVDIVPAPPGSEGDPIVTKSYVDQEIVKYSTDLDTLIAKNLELEEKVAALEEKLAASGSPLFEVLELQAGKIVLLGASAEFILRSGTATAISGTYGGLSNMTTGGKDVTTGQSVPLNNMLISSRDDGRGIKTTSSKVFALVKGGYTIK